MSAPERLIPDADVIRVHGNANFGSMSPRDVIADGVLKYAYGYQSGHTQLSILLEHKLIRKPKPGSYRSTLTKRGQAYLRAAWPYNQIAAALARAERAEAELAKLADPNAVHVSMLAGTVAKPSWDQIKHIYAREAERAEALLAEAVEALKGALMYFPQDTVECRGDKCREPWCVSCFGQEAAEVGLSKADTKATNARAIVAKLEAKP